MTHKGYAHPEKVVTTDWVAEHLNDPKVRIVESNEDVLLYSRGHIPGAVQIDWVADLNDPITRDYLNKAQFEDLMSRNGIANDTFVVFYGCLLYTSDAA
ncbi:MAG: rhodanese-like domain-containing protein, partial [Anaerolineae bacterium]|nr:rhodanese-like domain-containing protein [Anaerolineae bacterium]